MGQQSLSPQHLDSMLESSDYLQKQLQDKASTDEIVSKDDWSQRNLQAVAYNANTWSFPGNLSASGTITGSSGPSGPSPGPAPGPASQCATLYMAQYPDVICSAATAAAWKPQTAASKVPKGSNTKGPLIGIWWYPYAGNPKVNPNPWNVNTPTAPVFGKAPIEVYTCAFNQVHGTKIEPHGNATLNLASGATPTGYTGTGSPLAATPLFDASGNPSLGNFMSDCALQCMSSDQKKVYDSISTPISILNIGGWGAGPTGLNWNDKDLQVIQEAVNHSNFATFMKQAYYNGISLDIEAAQYGAADGNLTPKTLGQLFSDIHQNYTTMLTVPGGGPGDNSGGRPFMDAWIADPTGADITPHVDYLCIMFYSGYDDSCQFTPDTMKEYITDLWTGCLGFVPEQIVLGLSATSYSEILSFLQATKDVAKGGMTRWYQYCTDPTNCVQVNTQTDPHSYTAWKPSCYSGTYGGTVPAVFCTEGHAAPPCTSTASGTYTVGARDGSTCYDITEKFCPTCGHDFQNILCPDTKANSCPDKIQPNDTGKYQCNRTSPCS